MLFSLRNVVKRYDETTALDVGSLDIEGGMVVGFTGPNGAGKSTLLQLLAGLLEPTSGAVTFDGEQVYPDGDPANVRRHVTYLAQNPTLFQMSVRNNVAYGLKLRGTPRVDRRKAADEALEAVGLARLADRKPHQLSAGERQRIAIARAICLRPKALILDEPTANVDRENVAVIEGLIRVLKKDDGVSTIMASHDHRQIGRLSDRIVSLESGRLAPPPFENLFEGRIEEHEGACFFIGPGGIRIEVIARRTGEAKIAIQPNEIILSKARFDSSVRNSLQGAIQSIEDRPDGSMRVTVNAGAPFAASITRHSLQEMSLAVGDGIFISFKSTGVIVL